jgi:hypothetical protein
MTALFAVLLMATAQPALAQGQPRTSRAPAVQAKGKPKRVTEAEVKLIQDYFIPFNKTLRPLPPGVAKNLVRGKKVPAGINMTRLPDTLAASLPARTTGRWVLAGNYVLLLDSADLIVDVVQAFTST